MFEHAAANRTDGNCLGNPSGDAHIKGLVPLLFFQLCQSMNKSIYVANWYYTGFFCIYGQIRVYRVGGQPSLCFEPVLSSVMYRSINYKPNLLWIHRTFCLPICMSACVLVCMLYCNLFIL